MKQSLTSMLAAVCLFVFSSCKKEQTNPESEASFTRTLTFTNQGNLQKQAQYKVTDPVESRAGFEEGSFYVFFNVNPSAISYFGDAIMLVVDGNHFRNKPVQKFTFTSANAQLKRARYTYSFDDRVGSTWGSITDSQTGVVFDGHLNITYYDPSAKLVSGEYVLIANNLITDPTKQGTIATPINPADKCNLTITGSFNYVRVQP